jgi:hypothetical protein
LPKLSFHFDGFLVTVGEVVEAEAEAEAEAGTGEGAETLSSAQMDGRTLGNVYGRRRKG